MRLKVNKKVFFSDIVHCYLNDKGDELIGVTSLMKKHGLGADYSGIPQDVLERAAERGSRVHRLLEDYDNGKAVEDCPILQSYKSLGLQVDSGQQHRQGAGGRLAGGCQDHLGAAHRST